MIIEKTSIDPNKCLNPVFFYDSARTAEKNVLEFMHKKGNFTLLLPGYIGYSAKEGSGIYDPVTDTDTKHLFYKINKDISINTSDLKNKLRSVPGKKVVFVVNYFGYPDANINDVIQICRDENAIIFEDCAHALYTDYIDHSCGHFGDYVIYSIHKMLPYEEGGFLKINTSVSEEEIKFYKARIDNTYNTIFNYNLYAIAMIRKKNANLWEKLCARNNKLSILHSYASNVTPQTFPIVIKEYDRTQLYFELNDSGFGAVSLYHTLIEPLRKNDYSEALWLSNHIINMPVHQDVAAWQIEAMYQKLTEIIGK